MSKFHKKLYILIAIFFAIFLLVFSVTPFAATKNDLSLKSTEYKKSQSVTILAGKIKADLSVPADTFLYNALLQAKNAGTMEFSGKNYPGLGFFVTDIGTLHSGNGKNLLYYINGKEATVGVSSHKLKDGDIVEWKLE